MRNRKQRLLLFRLGNTLWLGGGGEKRCCRVWWSNISWEFFPSLQRERKDFFALLWKFASSCGAFHVEMNEDCRIRGTDLMSACHQLHDLDKTWMASGVEDAWDELKLQELFDALRWPQSSSFSSSFMLLESSLSLPKPNKPSHKSKSASRVLALKFPSLQDWMLCVYTVRFP